MLELKDELSQTHETGTDLAARTRRYLMTTDEIVEWIRKAPRTTKFCIRIGINTPVLSDDGQPTGRYFDRGVAGYLRVPGRQALDLVRQGLSKGLEERGARWPASRQEYSILDKKYVTYWIG